MISGSQIGSVSLLGLGIWYANTDSTPRDIVLRGIAFAIAGSILGAGMWVAGKVENLVSNDMEGQGYSDFSKRITSIALGSLAGAGTLVLICVTAYATLRN